MADAADAAKNARLPRIPRHPSNTTNRFARPPRIRRALDERARENARHTRNFR